MVLGKSAPVLFFGITSIFAGVLTPLLPETLNRKLPDTVDQAKFDDSDTETWIKVYMSWLNHFVEHTCYSLEKQKLIFD